MNPSVRIEQTFSGFIQFADLMNPELRRDVAEWLFLYLFDPTFPALLHLSQSDIPEKYPNWNLLFQQIFEFSDLRITTTHNEDLSISVARSTLNWARQAYQQFEAGYAHANEEEEYHQLRKEGRSLTPEKWTQLLQKLQRSYPNHGLSWTFYRERFQHPEAETLGDLEVMQQNVLDDWKQFLFTRKQKLESGYLTGAIDSHIIDLTEKVESLQELGDLVSPYYNFIGQVWNDSIGTWDRIEWNKMEQYAKTLQDDPNLQELARLLGKWNLSEQEMEEEKMRKPLEEETWEPNPYGKSEITGITHSDLISAILPSEVALLSSPETELIFAKKFVEKKLLTFEYRSQDLGTRQIESPEAIAFAQRADRGPMILCIDTSGSMFGEPEQIAKALALAILNIAIKQERPAYLISFSTAIQTLEITGVDADVSKMVDFLAMSFHGGTDIQPALKEALDMLQREKYQHADVLVISDFVIPRLDKDVYEQLLDTRRNNQTHYHGMLIVRGYDPRVPPLPIFDHHWIYDLDNPKVIRQTLDHFRSLEHSNQPI